MPAGCPELMTTIFFGALGAGALAWGPPWLTLVVGAQATEATRATINKVAILTERIRHPLAS